MARRLTTIDKLESRDCRFDPCRGQKDSFLLLFLFLFFVVPALLISCAECCRLRGCQWKIGERCAGGAMESSEDRMIMCELLRSCFSLALLAAVVPQTRGL
jgi:hypothetical protein